MRWLLIPLFSLMALEVQSATSASAAAASPQPPFQEPFTAAALGQLVIGLLLVVGLIFLFFWLLRRFSGISPMNKQMQVLGVLPLGTREKAVLVKVGDKQLLLGVAPGRVSHLYSFDGEVVDSSVSQEGFAARLNEALKRRQERLDD